MRAQTCCSLAALMALSLPATSQLVPRDGGPTSDWTTLVSPEPSEDGYFGYDVALSGDTLLVGEFGADAAHVFVHRGSSWAWQATLTDPTALHHDAFGKSVALDGDIAVVGAPGADLQASATSNEGAAFVFVRHGSSWTQEAKLVASDPTTNGGFGKSVALSGTTAAVYPFNTRTDIQTAYVFERMPSGWVEEGRLVSPDAVQAYPSSGGAVAVSGRTVILTVPNADAGVVPKAGAAHVFVRVGGSWSWQAKLTASDAARFPGFGASVALDGNMALIGGNEDVEGPASAYVFERAGASWTETAKLVARDPVPVPVVQTDVALSDGIAVLGGVEVAGSNPAPVHVFRLRGGTWKQIRTLVEPHGDTFNAFAKSVAVDGHRVAIGAPLDDLHYWLPSSGTAHVVTIQEP